MPNKTKDDNAPTGTGGTAVAPTSRNWPNGEPQSVRDAADKQVAA